MGNDRRLIAEWEPQSHIMITIPDSSTDWKYILDEILKCYRDILLSINDTPLIIVSSSINQAITALGYSLKDNDSIFECPVNDTWVRDYGPISCKEKDKTILLDFAFNGWGLKFAANNDNMVSSLVCKQLLSNSLESNLDFVLEGGSIETDGQGTILTTSRCLLSHNRNGIVSKNHIEQELRKRLGAKRVLWLDYGGLEGDDTDGHIDTLARICPNDTILYTSTNDSNRKCYDELNLMQKQLEEFRTNSDKPYNLIKLPLPPIIIDENGDILPATYANYLITNNKVIVPTYNYPRSDNYAMDIISSVFQGREIVGVDCRALIKQHGSLHCATMQIHK